MADVHDSPIHLYLLQGLCRGVYGPTLMELRAITQVSLTQVSMLFTCLGVGGIAGSLTFGRLFDLFNPLVLFVVALTGVGLVTALIPHLPLLTLMMTACAAHSFLYSGLAIGKTSVNFRYTCIYMQNYTFKMLKVFEIRPCEKHLQCIFCSSLILITVSYI